MWLQPIHSNPPNFYLYLTLVCSAVGCVSLSLDFSVDDKDDLMSVFTASSDGATGGSWTDSGLISVAILDSSFRSRVMCLNKPHHFNSI